MLMYTSRILDLGAVCAVNVSLGVAITKRREYYYYNNNTSSHQFFFFYFFYYIIMLA